MSPTRYLDLLLGATCLLLGALLVQALRREDPSPVGPAVPPPKTTPLQAVAQPTAEAATRVFFSLEHYQEIPERPLFARNRRPPIPAPVAPPPPRERPPPSRPLSLVLVGIARAGEEGVALLRRRGDGRIQRLPRGSSMDGWKVERILDESVALRNGTRSEQLKLPRRQKTATPPGTPPDRSHFQAFPEHPQDFPNTEGEPFPPLQDPAWQRIQELEAAGEPLPPPQDPVWQRIQELEAQRQNAPPGANFPQ